MYEVLTLTLYRALVQLYTTSNHIKVYLFINNILFCVTQAKKKYLEFKGPTLMPYYTLFCITQAKKKLNLKAPPLCPNIHYSM
jgi:hypothetical protein